MGNVWRSKFELGRAPIFGKTCFGLMGKEEPKNSLLTHYAFTSSLPHAFLGSSRTFFLIHPPFMLGSHVAEPSCILSFTCSVVFLIFPCPRNPFLGCWVNGQQGYTILGFIVTTFACAIPIIIVEFKFLTHGSISPFYQSIFGCKTFFPQTQNLHLVVSASNVLVWTGLEWKREELAW